LRAGDRQRHRQGLSRAGHRAVCHAGRRGFHAGCRAGGRLPRPEGKTKFLAQIAAAVAVCAAGLRIETVAFGKLFSIEFGYLAWPVTVFWIVGITNTINLIDGLTDWLPGYARSHAR